MSLPLMAGSLKFKPRPSIVRSLSPARLTGGRVLAGVVGGGVESMAGDDRELEEDM